MSIIGRKIAATNFLMSAYPAEVDDTDAGTTVDLNAYEGLDFLAFQNIGTLGGSDTPTLVGKWQESANGSVWADIAGATFTPVTTANNRQVLLVTRTQRYVRHSRAVSGTSPTFVMDAGVLPLLDATTPVDPDSVLPGCVPLSGDESYDVVPGQPNAKIRVLACLVGTDAEETVKFASNLVDDEGDPLVLTNLIGAVPLAENGNFELDYAREGYFETNTGEALRLIKSGAGELGGFVFWAKIPS